MTVDEKTVKSYWIASEPEKATKVFGLRPSERIAKQFEKENVEIRRLDSLDNFTDDLVLIVHANAIFDFSVLDGLLKLSEVCLTDMAGKPLAVVSSNDKAKAAAVWIDGGTFPKGFKVAKPEEVGGSYNHVLRKKEPAAAYFVTKDNVSDIEWSLYGTSYKGVTDLVTKYWWPVPAFYVTKLCTALKITPNQVTSVGFALMFAALYLFYQGDFALGLLLGWIMTFLDTVDGKLARTTMTYSQWGNVFDHSIDLFHPPFWWVAWGIGLSHHGMGIPDEYFNLFVAAVFAGYIGGRFCEGFFIQRHGCHIHVWRRIDSFFRLIAYRRNPNLIVLTLSLFAGRPDVGLYLIVLWSFITIAIHFVQMFQAEVQKPIRSWLQK